jgi:hypothetical protein
MQNAIPIAKGFLGSAEKFPKQHMIVIHAILPLHRIPPAVVEGGL